MQTHQMRMQDGGLTRMQDGGLTSNISMIDMTRQRCWSSPRLSWTSCLVLLSAAMTINRHRLWQVSFNHVTWLSTDTDSDESPSTTSHDYQPTQTLTSLLRQRHMTINRHRLWQVSFDNVMTSLLRQRHMTTNRHRLWQVSFNNVTWNKVNRQKQKLADIVGRKVGRQMPVNGSMTQSNFHQILFAKVYKMVYLISFVSLCQQEHKVPHFLPEVRKVSCLSPVQSDTVLSTNLNMSHQPISKQDSGR